MNAFLAMGGYALYVWPAYGITLIVLALIWWDGARRRRAVERELQSINRSATTAPDSAAS